MGRSASTQNAIMGLLSDGLPRSTFLISQEIGKTSKAVESACYRSWRGGKILRSSKELFDNFTQFKGRSGYVTNQRKFFKYTLRPAGKDSVVIQGMRYVPYGQEHLSNKMPKGKSKA
ncbi:MAG: hypothetical protein ACTSW1_13935 [Candidatus Hodarchaeales archaeon]